MRLISIPHGIRACLFALATVGIAPFSSAAEEAASPGSEYERAVTAYLDAASTETTALRQQAEAARKEADEAVLERFEDLTVMAKVDRCAEVLARLKKAGPDLFDTIKLEYENARGAAKQALAAAVEPTEFEEEAGAPPG